MAEIAIRLSTEKVSEKSFEAYNACRLITLKNPGVQHIGVGEVLRRIIGKCIIKHIENDLCFLGGNTKLCLGQKCGIEHAIHSLRSQYEKPKNEAFLLLDAENAFNCLNLSWQLKKLREFAPPCFLLFKPHIQPSRIYMSQEKHWYLEGTTQGEPMLWVCME